MDTGKGSGTRGKKRLLFVEDNVFLLEAYRLMLGSHFGDWEVATAPDGRAALLLMEQSPFDVVVSDMRMPGMSGLELFDHVKVRYPCAARVILSGISDQEEAARCLGATHQFLPKPIEPKVLQATIARIGALDALLKDNALKALVSQLTGLPSFPSIYLEVMKELSSDEPSIEVIAEIISREPGMTAKILQTANSPIYGIARQVADPFEAVQFLGMFAVRSIVLSSQVFSFFERKSAMCFSLHQLWEHSMKTAQLARAILESEKADSQEADDAYLAGMLHDIGKLMLAHNLPEKYREAVKLAAARNIPHHQAELEIFGATHAAAAAYLLGLWGLPATVVEAVAFHHAPSGSDLRALGPLAAVHVANALATKPAVEPEAERRSRMDMDYLNAIGKADSIEAWRSRAQIAGEQTP